MSKKKIYIAGKVTGEPQAECELKFATAKQKIEALGFESINPLEVVGDWQTPWNKAMRMCISKLTECDAIVLITDWSSSKEPYLNMRLQNNLKYLILELQLLAYRI